MTADFQPEKIPIKNFDAAKQLKFFQALRQNRFSGQLKFQDTRDIWWIFFLYLGRIVYATGGRHPVRRWRRNLVSYLPQIAQQLSEELKKIDLEKESEIRLIWDYHLLHLWLARKKVDLEQITKNIRTLTSEILFDLTQATEVSFDLIPEEELSFSPLAMIDAEQQILSTKELWHQWQELNLPNINPDLAPNIINKQKLQEKTSEKTYQILLRLLDGKHSIRDLAVQKKSDPVTFMRSLIPYVQLDIIDFLEIPDIPYPIVIPEPKSSLQPIIQGSSAENQDFLIACVTQNNIMNQVIEKVSTTFNYNLIHHRDSMVALPMLLEEKPDLIFLDLELSGFSGYEVCTQLRQAEYFAKTPILLFGKNIGLVEKMKSKMSGASEVFQQSMDVQLILHFIKKYLP